MSSLSEAKKQLQFNREFVGMVGILKGVAASQFQSLMQKRQRFEKFKESFEGFFRLVNFAGVQSPFVFSQSETTGVVLITSDEGFMGGLNAKVIHAAIAAAGPGKKEWFVFGGRGADILRGMQMPHTALPGIDHEKKYEEALRLKAVLIEQVLQKKIGKVLLAYPYPVSLMVQRPEMVSFLPCSELFQKKENALGDKREVLLESSPEKIIQYLVEMWMTYRLCDIFAESKLAEIAARTTHLEQSHDRLTEQGKMLQYRYFRCRREQIDKGIRETFSAILLRRGLEHG